MLQIGLVTVIASSEAVTTQVYCVCVPSRSAMIVGSAVETIVALTIATKSADISPTRTSTISLWFISAGRVEVWVSGMCVLAVAVSMVSAALSPRGSWSRRARSWTTVAASEIASGSHAPSRTPRASHIAVRTSSSWSRPRSVALISSARRSAGSA